MKKGRLVINIAVDFEYPSQRLGVSGGIVLENNNIDHPAHYCNGGMECIDEMLTVFGREAVKHFCLLNVWKYRKRALYKNGEEDLKKADWYMKKLVELEGNENERNGKVVR